MILVGASIRVVNLVEFGVYPPILQGFNFEGCTLHGPAVLAILERNEISFSNFAGDLEAMLWEVPSGRSLIGCVGIRDCKFTRCQFIGLGVAGTPETIAAIRAGITSVGATEAPPWWPWK